MNVNTNNYKDLEDVCHEWCVIVTLGDFESGNACFPKLEVQIESPQAWLFLCASMLWNILSAPI